MRYSQVAKSSPHCVPSPDGSLFAVLFPTTLQVRTTGSLEISRNVDLAPDLSKDVVGVKWSPSSKRLALAVTDQVQVFDIKDATYRATIRNPLGPGTRVTLVEFGATDQEICVWSAFGIKLSIFDLATSKAVEIANPKFHTPLTASKSFSIRPRTHHLALITRTAGKDTISIHAPGSREVVRSWLPDTVDAQGLAWSPDATWLVVWESPSQGHKVLFYTPDGNVFREWRGSARHSTPNRDLGAGVRVVAFSPDHKHIAIGDSDGSISILFAPHASDVTVLRHPQSCQPRDTLQIWLQQTQQSGDAASSGFVRSLQPVEPLNQPSSGKNEATLGCNLAVFDCSSTLLATRLEEAPSTVWIWDIPTSELRAVLLYHVKISAIHWHPSQPELLLIRCEGEDRFGYVWDPISQGPRPIDTTRHFEPKGRLQAAWLDLDAEAASIFCSDSTNCVVASLADADAPDLPIPDTRAPDDCPMAGATSPSVVGDSSDMDEGQLDDTFHFKNLSKS